MGEKTTDFIFGELSAQRNFNYNMAKIANITRKTLNAQLKFNKAMLIFAGLGVAYMYINDKRISKLTKEVEELKRTKGE